jgi:hypothetical protein
MSPSCIVTCVIAEPSPATAIVDGYDVASPPSAAAIGALEQCSPTGGAPTTSGGSEVGTALVSGGVVVSGGSAGSVVVVVSAGWVVVVVSAGSVVSTGSVVSAGGGVPFGSELAVDGGGAVVDAVVVGAVVVDGAEVEASEDSGAAGSVDSVTSALGCATATGPPAPGVTTEPSTEHAAIPASRNHRRPTWDIVANSRSAAHRNRAGS